MKAIYTILLSIVCLLFQTACSSDVPKQKIGPAVNEINILPHPRLLFTQEDEQRVINLIKTDPLAGKLNDLLRKNAEKLLVAPSIPYQLNSSGQMLSVSREYVKRFLTLSLAYRLSRDHRFLDKINEMLLYVCNFPNWNRKHFLDTAEMTTAVAVAYDWLYDVLPEETKNKVAATIRKRALDIVVQEYRDGTDGSWAKRETNWNVVCNTGMTLGALALAEENPERATHILKNAVKYIPNCLKHFAPDGVCYEGPAYWGYTNIYLALFLKTLNDNFRTDFGISALPGVNKTAEYYVHTISPSGKVFNFADASSTDPEEFPAFFLFSKLFNQPEVAVWYRGLLKQIIAKQNCSDRFFALSLPWFDTSTSASSYAFPRLQVYRGINDIIVFNGSRQVPSSIYLIAKGADPDMAHQQMDGGTFIIETDGIRWTDDLGSESYNLPGFWEYYGRRWNYFLNTNLAHNTLNIDGKIHNPKGTAHVVEENADCEQPYAVLDMTTLYEKQASKVTRRFQMTDDNTMEIIDDFALSDPKSEMVWSMVTRTNVTVRGNTVLLEKDGKYMTMQVLAPKNVAFSTRPARSYTDKESAIEEGTLIVECKYKPETTDPRQIIVRFRSGK